MRKRLYFLLPDRDKTRALVEQLQGQNIALHHMHTVAGAGIDLHGLPVANHRQLQDMGAKVESWLWQGNLLLFFISLFSLGALIVMRTGWGIMFIPASVMLLTLGLGVYFALFIPHVHLDEFREALKHKEILLMVDVPVHRVAEIETFVHRHHVEAVTGGVGWSVDALHI